MSYFFARAKERAAEPYGGLDDGRGREGRRGRRRARFRHAGPKPQTREAALIMLADGVEASVRSLASRDEPAIRAMVTRIIEERISDGQFDECDLTLRDLERIREAFVEQLLGMYHTRIAYPQNTVVELESRRAAAAAAAGAHGAGPRRSDAGPSTLAARPSPCAGVSTGPWRIDVDVRDGVDPPVAARGLARRSRGARRGRRPAPASIGLILTDDAELAGLNATHMGKDGPTDVLSFPLLPPEAFPSSGRRAPRRPRPPAARRTSATSSCPSSGPSSRPRPAAAARPATSAGRRRTSCACSSPTARSTSAAGTTPSPPRRPRCAPSSGGCSRPGRHA